MDTKKLNQELSRDEGRRSAPYLDTENIWTVGVGRNLRAHGLTGLPEEMLVDLINRAGGLDEEEIDILLEYDIKMAYKIVDRLHPRWRDVGECRQRAMVNMAFNMGYSVFAKFKKFWAAVQKDDWKEAKVQALDSKWAPQVGPRADRIVNMLAENRDDLG